MKINLKQLLYPCLLLLLTVVIAVINYQPDTFLSGWDTLHPEFNFPLNFKRLIFGVWRSDQGLGALAGHSHMADLPRVFILWLFHFFLPLSFLRYSYIFLCLLLGPIGLYFLISTIVSKKTRHPNLIAFISSLLYLFNLSTLQQFYVVFEMFPTQWALLPWILWATLNFLRHNKKFHLILFFVFTLFAAPQAYAAHLWYPFFGVYLLFLIIYSRFQKKASKSALLLIAFTLLINSFWLLPNLYFIKNGSQFPKDNKSNRLYSQEFLLKNRETGTLKDAALIKGFYFNWNIYDFNSRSSPKLMPQWEHHLANTDIQLIGYAVFAASFFGLILAFKQKNKLLLTLSPFFIIPFALLANRTFPFNIIFDLFLKIPFLQEAFRFIFTKISILALIGLVIFFSNFLVYLFDKLKTFKLIYSLSGLVTFLLFIFSYPYFQGQLISPQIKIKYPTTYFQFWDTMSKLEPGKTLALPLHEISGWTYYNWGYQGSGHIWFGMPQSIFDRDSDRWEPKNEQAYREFSHAIYSNNPLLFKNAASKHKVRYLFWDQNIISTTKKNEDQITFKNEIAWLLERLENEKYISPVFNHEGLILYQTTQDNALVEIKTIDKHVEPPFQWSYYDPHYNFGDYVSLLPTDDATSTYPFRNILTATDRIDPDKLKISKSNHQWLLEFTSPPPKLNLPHPSEIGNIPAAIYLQSFDPSTQTAQVRFEFPLPSQTIGSLNLVHTIKTIKNVLFVNFNHFRLDSYLTGLNQETLLGFANIFNQYDNYSANTFLDFNFENVPQNNPFFPPFSVKATGIELSPTEIFQHNPDSPGLILTNNSLIYQTKKDTQGSLIPFPELSHRFGYIIGIKSRYRQGLPLRLCLKNTYTQVCSINDQLDKHKKSDWDHFLIPPTDPDVGYEIHLNALSFAGITSKTEVESIVLIPIAYSFMAHISSPSTSDTNLPITSLAPDIIYQLPNLSLVKLRSSETIPTNTYLGLNQSYNKAWHAFYLNNGIPVFLNDHVLINNWANGWKISKELPGQTDIYIFFWPQLLEFLGFVLLPLPLLYSLLRKK